MQAPLVLDDGHWRMDLQHAKPGRPGQDGDDRQSSEPHWPAYTLPELEALAEFVERNDLILVSDEIHCNIVLAENPAFTHRPGCSDHCQPHDQPICSRPIPGLGCAAAIIPDPQLRAQFQTQEAGLVQASAINIVASEAAFKDEVIG